VKGKWESFIVGGQKDAKTRPDREHIHGPSSRDGRGKGSKGRNGKKRCPNPKERLPLHLDGNESLGPHGGRREKPGGGRGTNLQLRKKDFGNYATRRDGPVAGSNTKAATRRGGGGGTGRKGTPPKTG